MRRIPKWLTQILLFLLAIGLAALSNGGSAFVQPVQNIPPSGFSQGAQSQLINIRLANNGLLLLLNGRPVTNVDRISNPERILIDLLGTSVPNYLHKVSVPINRFGIIQVRIAQFQNNPAIARVVLDLDQNDPKSGQEWQTAQVAGGLLISPRSESFNTPRPPRVEVSPPSNGDSTVIQRLILNGSGQLLIQANRELRYQGSSDRPSGTYNLVISPATISPQLQRPVLAANSPLERIRLTQVGRSVTVGIKVSPGWQMQELGNVDSNQVALQLVSSNAQTAPSIRPGAGANPSRPLVNLPPGRTTSQPPLLPDPIPGIDPSKRGRGVIFIDPGHGGRDVGAIGNGVFEKDVVLAISLQLGKILQQAGYGVVYSRTTDLEVDLQPRVKAAEQNRADVFVSVHANSLESRLSNVNGVETYFAPGASRSKILAELVQNQIISLTGANDRGARSARFFVIRNTSMPAILVETGFVTNPTEAANLNNPGYQEKMAAAIARGVDQYLRR
jgi:N-acetylmuramoyl-L-alanine amidase